MSTTAVRPFFFAAISLLTAPSLLAQGWSQIQTLGSPPARNSHAMCFDLARGVTVLFGGYVGPAQGLADTWESNGFGWLPRFSAAAPVARWGHGMAYDARRQRTVLFGGYSPIVGSWLGDTWEWDGNNWSQRTTAQAPAARGYLSMAYDSWRGLAVVYGGETNGGAFLDDAWGFDGANWTQIAASGPGARRGAAMAFDDARGQMVVFGGGDGAAVFGDTWTLDGATWTQRAPTQTPSARWASRLGFDTLCGQAVLHGGADLGYATNYGDSWSWDGADWTPVAGAAPPARHGGALCFDARLGQMLSFGGRDAAGFYSDTWQLGSACSRTMAVVTPPQVGLMGQFAYSYPPSAAGHFCFHLVTGPQAGCYPVPIPGFSSLGLARVNLFALYLQQGALLDASGSNLLTLPLPFDPVLSGVPIDVQSLDLSLSSNTLYWAQNDAEVTLLPPTPPPVASFDATPRLGAAPLVVQFSDTSTNSPTSWQWDFDNDGVVDSTQQSPTWTYTQDGIYAVRLVATSQWGSGTVTQQNCVGVGVPDPLRFVAIQPGTFQMGSMAGLAGEQPVHTVAITQPFWMGAYEVTQAEYQAVMGSNPSRFQGASYPNAAQRPVEQVSWNSAMTYCAALTATEAAAGRIPAGYQYRLPTEAEWEYCCRAGTTTEWNTGASLNMSQANFNVLSGQTTVVGSYAANPWGLFDTHGNVWEWCLDSWDLSANYPSSAVSDPYVASGPYRVLRGGGWYIPSFNCRAASRNGNNPGFAFNDIGFRVVLAPVLVP